MLTFHDSRDASAATRRQFLQVGTAAVGGLTLSSLCRVREAAAAGGLLKNVVKDRSVVVLNLQGGPTQFETFDPKMDAPREIRSITGEVRTTLPGVTFGGSLPTLARWAHKIAVVRSYRHGISSHGPAAMHVMAGGNSTGAMMGALYGRVAGLTDPRTGLPRNVLVTAQAMGDEYKKLYKNTERVSQTGTLAPAYRPLDLSSGSEIVDNMRLRIDRRRLGDAPTYPPP